MPEPGELIGRSPQSQSLASEEMLHVDLSVAITLTLQQLCNTCPRQDYSNSYDLSKYTAKGAAESAANGVPR